MIKRISREELQTMISHGNDFVLIDSLPVEAYRKGHLPGAISIPSDDIIAESPRRLPDCHVEIVVYCSNGPCKRSDKAAARLTRLGYTNVRDYHEGKADWVAAGLPLDPT
ncbi:MAG: rhodanese-like domain-containing protein [Gammaproteobacteria bacterium]